MSDKPCENGCVIPPSFPRRPGENPLTSHGEGCFCCNSDERVSSDNRPALPHFNYRIGSYGSIREYLLHQINQTPNLRNWTHRAPDDPAIALLEGAAILGDILTFYQETYANEAFLRTARWRESISDLVRLLGYRLSPAVGGKATFAFEIKKDEPVVIPAGFPVKATLEELPKPAEFETLEEITAYPWLSRFSLFRPLDDPLIEDKTTEFYISDPKAPGEQPEIKVGDRILVADPNATALAGSDTFENAEIVIVDSIREQHQRKYYTIKGNLSRQSNIPSLTAFRLGRTFHHFGYNSPLEIVDSSAEITSRATVAGQTTTSTTTIPKITVAAGRPVSTSPDSFRGSGVSKPLRDTEIPIDSEVKDLAAGTRVVIQSVFWEPSALLANAFEYQPPQPPQLFPYWPSIGTGFLQQSFLFGGVFSEYLWYAPTTMDQILDLLGAVRPVLTSVRTIKDVRPSTLTWGGISGTVSQLTLDSSLGSSVGSNKWMQIPESQIHEVIGSPLTLKRAHVENPATSGNTLNFFGTANQAENLNGRRIMLEIPGGEARVAKVKQVEADTTAIDYSALHKITLDPPVNYDDFPNDGPITTVFGNLADADEGKTLPEVVLGSGNAALVFQNFKVPKAPLTYHIVPENTPSETPEAEIYVDGRLWTKVDSFFGRGSDEQVYIVREDADGNSWIQFGDGKTGSRLTTGVKNVTAIHRVGAGAYGPLKADTKVQASAKLKNLDKVQMSQVASGGTGPEDGENARAAAPGKVQSLGRIVSLSDFESEASAIPGVASAAAAWELVDNVPAVAVTVLMETGRAAEKKAVGDTLRSYNTARGAARHSVDVRDGKRIYVAVSLNYALKAGYRADLVEPLIRLALGVNYGKATRDEDQTGLFSLRRRRFGIGEYVASVEGVVQNVEGVLWAKADRFEKLIVPTDGSPGFETFNEDDPETFVLPTTPVLDAIVECGTGQILSLFDKHLFLTAVKAEGI